MSPPSTPPAIPASPFDSSLPPAHGRGDAVREPAEGERLQDDVARPRQRRVEESFAAEQRIAESADELDVVIDRLAIDTMQPVSTRSCLAGREVELQHVAAGVQEHQALSADLLQDEAFAAEQPRAESLRERDRQIDVADRAEVRVALREDRVAVELDRERSSRRSDWPAPAAPEAALQRKTLMNSDSPARNLRISPFISPPCMRACRSIPGPMYSIAPASAYSSSFCCSSSAAPASRRRRSCIPCVTLTGCRLRISGEPRVGLCSGSTRAVHQRS